MSRKMEYFTLDILSFETVGDEIKIQKLIVTNVLSFKCRCIRCCESFTSHAALQTHIQINHLKEGNQIGHTRYIPDTTAVPTPCVVHTSPQPADTSVPMAAHVEAKSPTVSTNSPPNFVAPQSTEVKKNRTWASPIGIDHASSTNEVNQSMLSVADEISANENMPIYQVPNNNNLISNVGLPASGNDPISDFADVKILIPLNEFSVVDGSNENGLRTGLLLDGSMLQLPEIPEQKGDYHPLLSRMLKTGTVESVCPVCKKEMDPSYLRVHVQMVHSDYRPFKCSVCGKCFKRQTCLKRHVIRHNDQRPFECTRCKRSAFKTLAELNSHIKYIHFSGKPFQCDVCGEKFVTKGERRLHMGVHRIPANLKPKPEQESMLCPDCGKQIKCGNFKGHMKRHIGGPKIACPICGKKYSDKQSMVTHTRTHTGVKPYKCNVCDKAFTRSWVLVVHKRMHTGEKPHQCHICGRSFTISNDLKRHIKRIHSNVPIEHHMCTFVYPDDSVCGRDCSNKYQLAKHVRSRHQQDNQEAEDSSVEREEDNS